MRRINIKLPLVELCGVQEKLSSGKNIFAFRGIPYAEPPIEHLRFKPPVPLVKFAEPILDCSEERDVCIHRDMLGRGIIGSENCLFLNVYTPEFNVNKPKKPLAVMMWLHGGAFAMGSGNSELYYPEHLLEEDVVVITCNYRLGPLGFLYLPKAGIYGNAGLFDQLLVLKWINSNIVFFNGDPNNVTLFGESAGGSSTHFHYLSRNSRKYFHKAICQSGTSNMDWVMQIDAEHKAKTLAKILGCESTEDDDILKCLQEAKPEEIVKKQLLTLDDDEKRRGLPMPFKPVVDSYSPDSIIKKTPHESIMNEGSINMPIMFGYNSCEGIIMLLDAMKKAEEYDKDFQKVIPMSVNLTPDSYCSIETGKDIKKFYFGDKKFSKENIRTIVNLMGDYHFAVAMQMSLEMHSIYQKRSPLYLYRFGYDGELNMFKKLFQLEEIKGACHGDELFYLFNMKMAEIEIDPNSESYKLRKTMCQFWTNFAKFGNPTPNEDSRLPVKWNCIKSSSENHDQIYENCLLIDKKIESNVNPDKNRLQFWKSLYKKWNSSFYKAKL